MNWTAEAHRSWSMLQWMREVLDEPVDPASSLCQLLRGWDKWEEEIAADRHGTGNLEQIHFNEFFMFAAAYMSRSAKDAIGDALSYACTWNVDDAKTWSEWLSADQTPTGVPMRFHEVAEPHWEAAQHIIKTTLDAWIMLWGDLDGFQGQLRGSLEQRLESWRELADQAAQTVEGAATAAAAQRR